MNPGDSPEPRAKSHAWQIDPREYARHETRRGRRHAFSRIEQRSTALVVIDMVAFFVNDNPYARGIVPNINALATALRAVGGTVAWVFPQANSEPSPLALEFYGPEVAARYAVSGGRGALPDRLWPELKGQPEDLWLEKSAPSAFFPGRSPLPDLLRARGIQTLLIAGTVTNVCCESSARDASTLGYRVIVVADANAASDDRSHNAALHTIYRSFGDVRPTDEVLALIGSAALAQLEPLVKPGL